MKKEMKYWLLVWILFIAVLITLRVIGFTFLRTKYGYIVWAIGFLLLVGTIWWAIQINKKK